MRNRRLMFAILLLVCSPLAGKAATLRVEKLSHMGYSVIQDAVDAAAPGDTIIIGPGRFLEYQSYNYHGWIEDIYVNLTKDVVLIGSGQDVTIIGPEHLEQDPVPNPKAIASVHDDINAIIQNLTIEHIVHGIV